MEDLLKELADKAYRILGVIEENVTNINRFSYSITFSKIEKDSVIAEIRFALLKEPSLTKRIVLDKFIINMSKADFEKHISKLYDLKEEYESYIRSKKYYFQ